LYRANPTALHHTKRHKVGSESRQPGAILVQDTCPVGGGILGTPFWNTLPGQSYQTIQNVRSTLCVSLAATTALPLVVQNRCTLGTDQLFREIPLNGFGDVFFQNAATGLCLGIQDDSADVGRPVVLTDCFGFHVMFRTFPVPVGDGAFQIVNTNSQKCVTVQSESELPGARLVQDSCPSGTIDPSSWQKPVL
jgi:hypothetical protein